MSQGRPKSELECEVKVVEKAVSLEDGHSVGLVVMVVLEKDAGRLFLGEDRHLYAPKWEHLASLLCVPQCCHRRRGVGDSGGLVKEWG